MPAGIILCCEAGCEAVARIDDIRPTPPVERVRGEFGLPVCDVIRDGPDELVDAVLALRTTLA